MNKLRRYVLLFILATVLLATIVAWAPSGLVYFTSGPGGSLIALATLSALLGVVLLLLQFVLISRSPWLEPAFGFDSLTRIHHYNGILAFSLITAHIPLVITGYALTAGVNVPAQLETFLQSFAYIPFAIAAHALLVLTIMTSIVIVRRRLRYELWHGIHFLNYAVLFLALIHQLAYGTTLSNVEWFRYLWIGLHIAVFANLFWYRFFVPLISYARQRWRVVDIVAETPDVTSVYIAGRHMDEFDYHAGAFAKWRFLAPGFWLEEHPFTISIEPNDAYLRISVKAVGDFTERIRERLPVGTPVMVSGPLGVFTLQRAKGRKSLFIAGGIGITPIRAMLGEVEEKHEVTLLYSASGQDELAFKQEIDELVKKRKVAVHYTLSQEKTDFAHYGRIDRGFIQAQVPDLAERDVFICGPSGFIDSVKEAALSLGSDPAAIHTERFSLH